MSTFFWIVEISYKFLAFTQLDATMKKCIHAPKYNVHKIHVQIAPVAGISLLFPSKLIQEMRGDTSTTKTTCLIHEMAV